MALPPPAGLSIESLFSSFSLSAINPFSTPSSVANTTSTSSPTSAFFEPFQALFSAFQAPLLAFYNSHPILLLCLAFTFSTFLAIHFFIFTPPSNLSHLPRVSPYPIMWSYIRKESVDRRVKRLILPVAERGEGVVAVWMLGKWGVHILDPDMLKVVAHDVHKFPKKNYQDHLHFTFLSGPNVVFSNGEQWKRHSESVKAAFDRDIPVWRFVGLGWDVLNMIGGSKDGNQDGVVKRFSDLVQKYTLDVVGTTLLGHNFDALRSTKDSFVEHFNIVMTSIASPIRLVFPFLDTYFPRHAVIAQVDELNRRYDGVLDVKKGDLGVDLLSYLLEDERLSREEVRSNLSILFSAGHDTTSGAISSCVYYLAKHPEHQATAREEVLRVLKSKGRTDPAYEDHPDFKFLYACIKEALRVNPPISLLPARWTTEDVILKSGPTTGGKKEYVIPKDVSLVPNVYAVHNCSKAWEDPEIFDPYRFLDEGKEGGRQRKKPRAVAHIPFGTGPRQCVARQFSLFEQRTLLAMLLAHYEWRLPKESAHESWVQNEFGAFGLSIPHHLDIEFLKR